MPSNRYMGGPRLNCSIIYTTVEIKNMNRMENMNKIPKTKIFLNTKGSFLRNGLLAWLGVPLFEIKYRMRKSKRIMPKNIPNLVKLYI